MIKYIKSLFTKKKPELYWGEFKEWDHCTSCNHLQEFYNFGGICPACGSRHVKKVVARWQSYTENKGFTVNVVRVKSEINNI